MIVRLDICVNKQLNRCTYKKKILADERIYEDAVFVSVFWRGYLSKIFVYLTKSLIKCCGYSTL